MPARSGYVDEERGEAMHPPEQGDVIDLDTTLREQFFEVAIRQTEPQTPAHRQHDHLRWEPEPHERRQRLDERWNDGDASPHNLYRPGAILQRRGGDVLGLNRERIVRYAVDRTGERWAQGPGSLASDRMVR